MLEVPDSLTIKRSKKSEALLMERSRKWIEGAERTPGIHASDLLSPRMAYWHRIRPTPISDRLVTTFLIGKVLHAFVLSAVDEAKGTDWSTDEGSKTSKELGIEYSIDSFLGKIPRELKTSRSPFEPRDAKDIWHYIEQLLIYMAAEDKTTGEIWVLYLSLREKSKTNPAYRAYKITVSQEDLDALKKHFKGMADAINKALDTKDHTPLPLCAAFKCKRTECAYFDECKPETRWKPARKKKEKAA